MIKRFTAIVLFLICVFSSVNSQQNPDNNKLFDDKSIFRVDIYIPEDSLNALYENPYSDYEYRATAVFTYSASKDSINDIGFRFRGNTSRSSAKKSFKISFNTFVKQRKYEGVEKVNLNGEHNDPSIARAKIVWDLFRDFQVPSSRANHAEVYINHKYYGLYLNVEHVDEVFVKSRFGNNNGNLYKCLSGANLRYTDNNQNSYKSLRSGNIIVYELHTNESSGDFSGLVHFIDILNNTSDANFETEIDKIFNVDNYLRAIALEILTGHWDNYIYNSNNYYLYQNLSTFKFEYIPYDVDNTFGIDWFGIDWTSRNIYKWGNGRSPLYERIMKVPAYRQRFTAYIKELLEKYYNQEVLFPKTDALLEQIKLSAESDNYRTLDYGWNYTDFLNSFEENLGRHVKSGIKPFIEKRYRSALAQLETITNVAENYSALVTTFPNPFQDQINIRTNQKSYHLRIFDISGKLVFNRNSEYESLFVWNGTNQSGQKLPEGIYVIEISDVNRRMVHKQKVVLLP